MQQKNIKVRASRLNDAADVEMARSQACLALAMKANQATAPDLKLYAGLCRILGTKMASKLAIFASSLRQSPGNATLPQSFSS